MSNVSKQEGLPGTHAAVLAAVVIAPLVTGVSLPEAMSRMEAFVLPADLPPAPMPQPVAPPAAATAPTVRPDAAPIHAPDTIQPEVSLPVPAVPPAIGALLPEGPFTGVPPTFGTGKAAPLSARIEGEVVLEAISRYRSS